jgi:S-sulfo-L-cysteine synthase (O-acetyl-L-serine-dependent)
MRRDISFRCSNSGADPPAEGKVMSVLDAIGNTPLAELDGLNPKRPTVRIFVKLEGNNPGGSVKDRAALRMIQDGEKSGELSPAQTILEATSGNTGIAMAMIGAAKGYRVKLCMAASVSVERRKILEALGAEMVLTPALERTDGAIRKARQMVAESPGEYFMPNQFDNPSNVLAHYESTGPEIFQQTEGRVDVFVAGMGTSGTLMGVSQYLKEAKPAVRVVGVEPPMGHRIQGLKNMQESIRPRIYDPDMLDDKITVMDHEAFAAARRLATLEGIFAGMSSGAAVAAALRVANRLARGTIVVLLPDRGDRYLSTELFRSAAEPTPKVA